MKLRWVLLVAIVFTGCGGQSLPAVVLAADGSELGSFASGQFGGSEPEFMALLDEMLSDETQGLDLESGSVSILTAFDPELQARARDAVVQFALRDGPDVAALALRRSDASVVAVATSAYGESPQLNDVVSGAGRPTGSALKPFALAAALETGMTLEQQFPAPECIRIPDNPTDETCGGTGTVVSLLDATVNSTNPVYVQLVEEIGVRAFGAVASAVGISSGGDFRGIDAVLGTYPVSLVEMAGAYRAVAEGGDYLEPTVALGWSNADGEVTLERRPATVLSEQIWSQVDDALREVVAQGTGQAANPGYPVAGKTGTGRNLANAWFAGYTDDVVLVVWAGFADEPTRRMVPPATSSAITGGSLPAEIWRAVMAPGTDLPPGQPQP